MGIHWTFEPRGLQGAIKALQANTADLSKPTRAAARSTGRVVRKLVSRRVQQMTGLSSAAMRRRFRIYDSYERETGAWSVRCWFGTRPLALYDVDAKVSAGGGIQTKTMHWPHGFIMTYKGKKIGMERFGPRRLINGRRKQALRSLRVPIHSHVVYALRVAQRKAQANYLNVFTDKLRQQMARGAMRA